MTKENNKNILNGIDIGEAPEAIFEIELEDSLEDGDGWETVEEEIEEAKEKNKPSSVPSLKKESSKPIEIPKPRNR